MTNLPDLQPYQRILWNVLCWNFPAEICKILEDTEQVYSDELHNLYDILQSSRGKGPSYLMAKLTGLSQPAAVETIDVLHALNVTGPSGGYGNAKAVQETKPYFYSREREAFWRYVLDLFEMEFLGRHADGSMRESVFDFHVLHLLYRLEMEDKRCRKGEDTNIQNPAHCWYHETSDQNIAQDEEEDEVKKIAGNQ
jgi:hypothetical protein